MIEIPTIATYVIDGSLGGLLYILVSKYGYDERYDIIRRLIIGAISGLVVFYLGWPDHITSVAVGYTGIDALEGIILKYNSIKTGTKDKTEKTN